ncbi:MAG: hypothetical protein Q4E64_00755 [Phascolarctobacterium sp.]|uniref:hypothetical protein n=1 Tax=Phascolarctobacterium sp. TaxID=2049039 RepID=UPI0026DB5B05|nr:hypothetical protein [Phascolarctobacterium sp.]MDO4920349.1 hypothetical protein [Phascolarctobacterium sp.]
MNFEFFAFLVFMSFVSFSVAFLAYGMVVRFMGKESFASRLGQIILVPACIVIYDFITMAAPSGYRYLVGGLPLLACAGIALYFRFVKGENFAEAKSPSELAQLTAEPKKFSKKSARIHAARKKRGGK